MQYGSIMDVFCRGEPPRARAGASWRCGALGTDSNPKQELPLAWAAAPTKTKKKKKKKKEPLRGFNSKSANRRASRPTGAAPHLHWRTASATGLKVANNSAFPHWAELCQTPPPGAHLGYPYAVELSAAVCRVYPLYISTVHFYCTYPLYMPIVHTYSVHAYCTHILCTYCVHLHTRLHPWLLDPSTVRSYLCTVHTC
jgi:hypothetical protein